MLYIRFLLVSLLTLFSASYARDQIGLLSIQPSVIHGMCTMCNTTSCANCRKCSSGCERDTRDSEAPPSCSLCANNSSYCSQAPSTIAQALKPCIDNPSNALSRCCLGCNAPLSVFIPRSQGANTARELAGWEEFIHQWDVGGYYLTTGTVLGYSHSLHPERIARLLFGDSVLHFAGSQVENRPRCALLADNFGLSTHFQGSVHFQPTIENIIFDNQFFIGLDPWLCGLYARIHAPLVHTRWNLKMKQTIISEHQECTEFPACYMGESPSAASCDIIQALSGNYTFGDMQTPWHYGRFACGTQSRTGLADIDLILGHDSWQSDFYHFGFYGQLVCPTGNRFKAHHIFEPLVGNAHHWELGLGISGHLVLWERDADQSLALWVEGNMTHLFKNRQMRSFDFCRNGLLSRYMLLKELTSVNGSLEYAGKLINAINFTTRAVEVSVPLQGDISAKLAYRSPCFIVDLGFNFYGKMREHLKIISCPNEPIYGIKGTEGVCALEYATEGTKPPLTFGPLVEKISLNATQHNASIRQPAHTDNPQVLPLLDPSNIAVTALSRQSGIIEGPGVMQAYSSNPPVVTIDDLHKETGTNDAQATYKVFGYLGYNFYEADWCYNPYLGLGGELELDARSCAERSALNQWSIWVKGGFEF